MAGNTPTQTALRQALGKLPAHGAEPWWIREVAAPLLDLELVVDRASPDKGADARAAAAADLLRETVGRMGETPPGVLLRVVLALEPQYRDLSAHERRRIAGELFRGGQRRVGEGTIRQYHEPRAFDALAEMLLADEERLRRGRDSAPPSVPRRPGAAPLGLADQSDFLRWADVLSARGDFPRLIRRLILETGQGVVRLGFPAGEGIASGSWDGSVLATEASVYVPSGLSLWELSVEKNAGAKASRDYANRHTTPDGSPTQTCTYVAVSLRRWAKRTEWERERSDDGRWGAVRALGVDDVEAWLETAPVTHAWLSELLGLHPHGLLSVEHWWSSWHNATRPPLPHSFVLAGRERALEAIRGELSRPPHIVTIEGPSRDDVLAFVAAFVTAEAETDGGALLARTAVVDHVEAWRRLRGHREPLVLIASSEEVAADVDAASGHHVIIPIADGSSADITLPRIDSQIAAEQLKSIGLVEDEATEVAGLARQSLMAARRRIARKPELQTPSWAKVPTSRPVRRLLLAGRWNESLAGDREILDALLGIPYDAVLEDVVALSSGGDPLVSRVGSSVGLVSHFDAWLLLRGQLRGDDLAPFREAALAVLGAPDPVLELDPEDRWRAALLGKSRSHSSELRAGVATTLALLGGHGESVVDGSLTGEDWAAWIVRELLERANADVTSTQWASLRDVLPLLAEAAPAEFLKAVRAGVMTEPPTLRGMFMDQPRPNGLSVDSAHSSLLWALEVCAWSPRDFGQAIDLLARLAEIDPGGRLANRPAASLESIFCPWHPQNNVNPVRRLSAIDGLRDRHEQVAWKLMLSMLPDQHGVSMNTSEPRFRDWKPDRIVVTMHDYWEFVEEICRRLLNDVGVELERWKQLVTELPNLPPPIRADALDQLESLATAGGLDAEGRRAIWESLRSMAAQHREFAKAAWALPAEEVTRIEEVAGQFEPSAPVERHAWLFESHMPDLADVRRGDDFDGYGVAVAEARAAAARAIADSLTWPELHAFAISTALPWYFGAALAQAGVVDYEDEVLSLLSGDLPADLDFALGYVSQRFRSQGWEWIDSRRDVRRLGPGQEAWLFLATHDFPKAWQVAEAAGAEAAELFWRRFRTNGLGADFPHVELVAQKLLDVNRPEAALDLLALYSRKEVEPERAELMATGLERLLAARDGNTDMNALRQYGLMEVFSYLQRSSLPRERVAQLEWAYLPAFGYGVTPPTLSAYLAKNPAFFVDVITRVYRPRTPGETEREGDLDEDAEPSEDERAVAANAYRLLSEWRTVPGLQPDGTVDGRALAEWVAEARRLLAEALRLEVGDVHIGHVLASSPTDADGKWPAVAVRDLLETLQSSNIEDGLRTQLYNSRGATSRGLLDGGEQERALVAKYREQADALIDRWPRIASVLDDLADGYDREARRHDAEAELRRTGLER